MYNVAARAENFLKKCEIKLQQQENRAAKTTSTKQLSKRILLKDALLRNWRVGDESANAKKGESGLSTNDEAKKFGHLDEQLQISTSNMFYPPGLTLSRKERLSLIWLAANYDPEKYRKIIPPKKCEEANIESICNAIMNPNVPYALRLSAQLMLGTVRVYRTKTKLILEMAEQMIVKLSSLISETSIRTYDMPVAMLRADAITIADTGMSIIDYSLEPVYYDPQMIMHMNEDDFITVNGSPLQSPIKIEKKGTSKKSMSTPTKAIVVSNSKISFQEDLLSPSKPIQIPTEDDEFGVMGFGPAQDNFLTDLMEIADIVRLKPKTLDFGPAEEELISTRLEPVMEDEENILRIPMGDEISAKSEQVSNASSSPRRKAELQHGLKDFELKEDDASSADGVSRKRKAGDMEDDSKSMTSGTLGEVADLDQLLKDATEVSSTLMARADELQQNAGGPSLSVNELQEEQVPVVVTEEQPPIPADKVQPIVEEQPLVEEAPPQDEAQADERQAVDDAVPGPSKSVCGEPGLPMDWETHFQTPSDAIVLKPLPSQPKKKRKLMVDKETFIESKDIKNNFTSVDKLIKVPLIAGSALPSGKDLVTKPIFKSNFRRLNCWWENNSIHEQGDPIALPLRYEINLEDSQTEEEEEEEEVIENPLSVPPASVAPQEEPMDEDEGLVAKEIPVEEWAPDAVATPMVPKTTSEGQNATSTSASGYDQTPSTIDILRGDSVSSGLRTFEQSGGDTLIAVDETPGNQASKTLTADINIEEEAMLAALPASPRISGIGLLPQDAGIDFEEAPELPTVHEQDEKIDFTADLLENSDILTDEYKTFQRKIFQSLRTSEQTVFQRLFPTTRTSRRDAALALYLTLNMHKNGYVELQQTELFGDIHIHKGRIS